MKHLFLLAVIGLLLFGCTGGPTPTATPASAPTLIPTPTPSPTPEPVAAAAVEAASVAIPIGSGLASLTGVRATAPENYIITTQSQYGSDVALSTMNRWDFESESFGRILRQVATAHITDRTLSWQSGASENYQGPSEFRMTWQGWGKGETVQAVLSRDGPSSLCATEDPSVEPECVTPKKEEVDALFKALSSNAFESAIETILPGTDIKTLLDIKKGEKGSYLSRPCQNYAFSLTETGTDLLNTLGFRTVADFSGKMCIDDQYGFPLMQEFKSAFADANERVARFSTAKVGVLQTSYHYRELCFVNKPCITGDFTNPYYLTVDYPETSNYFIKPSELAACKPAGRVRMKIGDCVRYDSNDAYVLKTVNEREFSLVEYDHNGKALGENHIRPQGDVRKDQFMLRGNIDDLDMAVAVEKLSADAADLEFIAYPQRSNEEPTPVPVRKYSRGFKDPAKPTVEEAYYAIFSPGSCRNEGLQKYANSDCVDLKNGAKVAFYWYYPEPYSEVSMAGRLDSRVTAYVWEKEHVVASGGVNKGQSIVLNVNTPVTLGIKGGRIVLNLREQDLTRDGSIRVEATSAVTTSS